MEIRFHKTRKLNGSKSVTIHLRSIAILNLENNDSFCFFWSLLAGLHPCKMIILTEFQIIGKNLRN